MSRKKAERQLNLIAMLLEAKKPVSLEEIRFSVQGYDQEDMASFKRMFERDKKELREMGVPIVMEPIDVFGEETGYRISKDDYYLPIVDFDPDEQLALWLLHRLVRKGGFLFSQEVQQALMKLSPDLGVESMGEKPNLDWFASDGGMEGENLSKLLRAVIDEKTVVFEYLSLHERKPIKREVDPYGLYYARGCWYLVGYCHFREGVRSFRISRIKSNVELARPKGKGSDFSRPSDFQVQDYSNREPWEFEEGEEFEAKVRFSPKLAWWVEENLGARYPCVKGKDGSCTLILKVKNRDVLVSWVCSFGEDAEILSPPDLREDMRATLEELKEIWQKG